MDDNMGKAAVSVTTEVKWFSFMKMNLYILYYRAFSRRLE